VSAGSLMPKPMAALTRKTPRRGELALRTPF
jgi:hypothetical protein